MLHKLQTLCAKRPGTFSIILMSCNKLVFQTTQAYYKIRRTYHLKARIWLIELRERKDLRISLAWILAFLATREQ